MNIPIPAPRYSNDDNKYGDNLVSNNLEKGALIPNNKAASIACPIEIYLR